MTLLNLTPATPKVVLLDANGTFLPDDDGNPGVLKKQLITEDFVTDLRKEYDDSGQFPAGPNFHRFASVPTIFIEEMLKDGIDVYKDKVDSKTVLSWLRKRELHGFITSKKV